MWLILGGPAGQPFVLSGILQLIGPRHASMVADLAAGIRALIVANTYAPTTKRPAASVPRLALA